MAVDIFARDLASAALAKAEGAGNNCAKLEGNNNFLGDQIIEGSLTINGDIIQIGSIYETHAEHVYTNNDLIFTREGAIGALTAGQVAGLEVVKYDGINNAQLVFDNTGTARVGNVDNTQPLLTRKETKDMIDGAVLVWDASEMVAKADRDALGLIASRNFLTGTTPPTSSTKADFIGQIYVDLNTKESYQCLAELNENYTWYKLINNSMIASSRNAGIVKINQSQGIDIDIDGALKIRSATLEDLNKKDISNIKPITVGILDEAVKSALSNSHVEWTNEEKAATRNLLGVNNNSENENCTVRIETTLPTDSLSVNTEYYLEETERISCVLPDGNLGDYILIKFKSGETPTLIELTPDKYIGDIPTPVANKTYELICTWNGEVWVFSYRGY